MSNQEQTSASSANPELTPSGYERTTGGKLRWQPPSVEKLQELLVAYDAISLIGHGGMGAVYRARQKSLDRSVAIKILPPEAAQEDATFAERFKNEARTLARLNHPGIVHVHDFGETTDGQLYIVMEFVEGTDVQRLLLDHGVLTPQYALPITAHVCDALLYAHSQGVVHRDIKPANILLTKEGQVKVADFGLAKLEDAGASALTQTNMSMGTPDYVAPETLTIGMTVDQRADLYAAGVMLYHMLVGEVPRGAFDLPSKRNAALDPRIDAIILRAMKQNRDERYQSAAEIRADLDTILATPVVKSGGEASAAISKRVVVQSKNAKAQTRSAPVKPVKKETTAAAVSVEEEESEAKPRNLAWVVPTGISAVVILGGAFFLRGQRKNEIAPEDVAAKTRVASFASPEKAPSGPPIKVSDYKPAAPTPDVASDEITGAAFLGCWTRDKKENHMILLTDGSVRLLRDGKEDTRPDGTPWWSGWRWKFADGLLHLYGEDGKEVETIALTAPDEGTLAKLSKGESFKTKRAALAPPGMWSPVRWPGDKPPKGDWKNGVLTLPKREFNNFPAAYSARDAAIRARVTNTSGDGSFKGIYFKLRNQNALGFFDLGQSDIVSVGAQPDFKKDLITLARSARGVVPLGKKDLLVEFAAIGDDLVLALDGKVVASAKTNGAGKVPAATEGRSNPPFLASIMAGWNAASFRDLEFMSLDGISADRQPDFIKRARAAGVLATSSVGVPASTGQASAPAAPPASAPSKVTSSPSLPLSASSPKLPAELSAVQSQYTAAIAERVTGPQDASLKQLNAGFTAALDRAVASRQLSAEAVAADKKAVENRASLPPDLDTTPDVLKTLRATYRAKSSELEEARTTAHLGLLTPYIAKLKQLEADLTKAARIPDAEAVKAYRESLSENPFALPQTKP